MIRKTPLFFFIAGIFIIGWAVSGFITYYTPVMAQSNWYPSIPFQKGMSYTTWGAYSFNSSQAITDLQVLKAAGVQWVAVNILWYQSNLTSFDIHAGNLSNPAETNTDSAANISAAFLYAKSIGLHIFFKPMLDLDSYTWRSLIVYTPQWMDAYTNWTVYCAEIAQNGSADMFSIGCEMGDMQSHTQGVLALIQDVRSVYHGLLTYCANWDSFWYTNWWYAVDLIGVDVYPPMTTEYNASIGELTNVWNGFYYRLEALSREWNKPIIFPEIGAQALMGANISPNDDELSTQQDIQGLVDYYTAFYESKIWTAPWFKGAYWWIWDPGYTNANISELTGFCPYLPPVLNVTEQYYKSPVVSIVSNVIPRTFIPFGIGIACFLIVLIQQMPRKGRKMQYNSLERSEEDNNINKGQESSIVAMSEPHPLLPISQLKENFMMSLLIGTWIYFIFLNYMLSLYSTVYSIISLGALLGESTTSILVMFAGMWLGAFFCAGFILKWKPNLLVPVAFLLVMGYPLAFLGNSLQTVNIIILFNLLVLFLITAAILSQHLKMTGIQIPVVLAGGFLTALILYALTIVFDQTAIMLAAVPLMGVMVLNCSRNNLPRTINLKQNSPIVEQPSPISISPENHGPVATKSRPENVVIIIALLVGVLVPFGSAQYNLMSANILPIVLYILPPLIIAAGISIGITLILRRHQQEFVLRKSVAKIGSPVALLFSTLILGVFGIGFVLRNISPIIWDLLSGLLFVQFLLLIFTVLDQSLSSRHVIKAYIFLMLLLTFLAVGFLLNGIKGLIIYSMNFLDLVNGVFVVRTDFAALPGMQIPTLVKTGLALSVAIIAGVLLIYKLIMQKVRSRKNEKN